MQNLKKQRTVSNNNNNNSTATTHDMGGVWLLIGRELKIPMVMVYGLLVAESQYQQTGEYDAQEAQGGLQVAPLLRVLRDHLLDDFSEQTAHVRVTQPEQLTAEFSDGRIGGGQIDSTHG